MSARRLIPASAAPAAPCVREAVICGLSPWEEALRLEEIALRKERGWTMTEAAAHCGITRQEISHLEHGRRAPRFATAVKVARGYGMEPEVYLRGARRWLRAGR